MMTTESRYRVKGLVQIAGEMNHPREVDTDLTDRRLMADIALMAFGSRTGNPF